MNGSIFFINDTAKEDDELRNIVMTRRGNDKSAISLFSKSCDFNIFQYIPRLFTITTNNSSAKFNTTILVDTSSVISDFLKENPNCLEYHLDITDEDNIISKFEQLYQGNSITFDEDDLIFTRRIADKLHLVNFPNFMKPKSLKTKDRLLRMNSQTGYTNLRVKISLPSFILFSTSNSMSTFKIQTKKNEYKCNKFGVLSSTVIREQLLKDPNLDHYFFDYDEDENEFQNICKVFNFENVELTKDNAEIIKEIGEDLGIECILEPTEKFISDLEKVTKAIDDQQNIIETIDELFDLLYNIKEETVNEVSNKIIESKWSQTEENVIELAAFIFQVIESTFILNSYLIELIVKLNESNSPKLKILIHFIKKQIFNCFNEKGDTSGFVSQFAYQLYKKGLIQKDELYENFRNLKILNSYFLSWFLPEYIESKSLKYNFDEKDNSILTNSMKVRLIYPCNPTKMDEYKKMRDKGEYDNEIANALRIDDVDTFQSIVSKSGENFLKGTIRQNIYEPLFNNDARFINYAAAYGSLKCFKYLLLNDEKIDESTLEMAIFGGNNELIRIVYNNEDKSNVKSNKFSFGKRKPFQNSNLNSISRTIKMHRNDLFDWIYEQKLGEINHQKALLSIVKCSIKNGNAHSLIHLIDNGFNFHNFSNDFTQFLESSSEKGFCLLTTLLLNLINEKDYQKHDTVSISPRSAVCFGNVAILKLFSENMPESKLETCLRIAINSNSIQIIQYFLENIINQKIKLNQLNSIDIINNAFSLTSNEVINQIINKIDESFPLKDFTFDSLIKLLKNSISNQKIEISKKLIDLILDNNSNNDFTYVFYDAVLFNMKEIVEYLIDKKCQIIYSNIIAKISQIGSIDTSIFSLIMNNIDDESKKIMNFSINYAIKHKNKPLINYLLDNQGVILDTSLIEAIETNDIEIVDMILNKKSDPSFINKNLESGNALLNSVKKQNIQIIKRLLSIPGINPSIYHKNLVTPLIMAASLLNETIFNLLIDFYKNDLKSQKWQFEKALNSILEIFQNKHNEKRNNSRVSGFGTLRSQNTNNKNDFNQDKIISILKIIIDTNCIDPNYYFKENTLLLYACKMNSVEIVKILLQYDDIDVNKYDSLTGDTPLITSIKMKNEEITNLLLNHSKVNINQNNYENESALIIAVLNDQDKIVNDILNNEKFNKEESNLNFAFSISNSKIAKLILASNFSFDVNFVPYEKFDVINSNKTSRIIKAINQDDIELIKLIINHPLFDKSKSRYLLIIETALFDNKIDILKQSFNFNVTFQTVDENILNVDLTMKDTNEKVVSYSFNYNNSKYIEIKISLNDDIKVKMISPCNFDYAKILKFLLNNCEDKSKLSDLWPTLFEEAIVNENMDIIKYLIDSELIQNINQQIPDEEKGNGRFTTILHLAIRKNNMEFISAILEYYETAIDFNITDDMGNTPLMEAVRIKNIDLLEFFFNQENLDFRHVNNEGKDALKIAIEMRDDINQDAFDKLENEEYDKSDYFQYLMQILEQ